MKKQATEAQKAIAQERREAIRGLSKQIAAMPIEKRVILADSYGLRSVDALHSYSPRNTILIMLQKPTASMVGGFRQWQKCGRKVCKGARGAAILVPCGSKKADGETSEPSGESEDMHFTTGYVFDIADTEEIEAPAPVAHVAASVAAAFGMDKLPASLVQIHPDPVPAPEITVRAARIADQSEFVWTASEESAA